MVRTRGRGRGETNERGKVSSRKMQQATEHEPLGRGHTPSSAPSVRGRGRGRGRPLPSRSSEASRPSHSPEERQVQGGLIGNELEVNNGIEEVANEESNSRVLFSVVVPRRSRYSDSNGPSSDGIQGPNGVVPTPSPASNPSRTRQVPSPPSVDSQRAYTVVPTPPPIVAGQGCTPPNPNPSPVTSVPESSHPVSRPTLIPTSDHPELREGVLWFDMRPVTNKIRQSIQVQFDGAYMNWSTTPQEVKDQWFRKFSLSVTQYFTWDLQLDYRVRELFNNRCARRLKNIVYNASKKDTFESWMGASVHKQVLEKRKDPAFVERSARAKKNKRSGVPEGEKVDPGHRQGPKSTLEIVEEMTKERGGIIPDAPDVYIRGHSVKASDGSRVVVGKKAEAIQAQYKETLEEAALSDTPLTPNEAYYKAVGGRKKGRVPGLGTGADIFYRSCEGRTRNASSAYSPSFVSQLQSQVKHVKDHCEERVSNLTKTYEMRLAAQEENMRRMEEYMTKFMGAVEERCGDMLPPDLFPPRGPDPDGGSGSFPIGAAAAGV